MDAAERQECVSRNFSEFYGALPEIWSRAPGRVDLMGSHTDYNMGYVMTMTIGRDTWIAARPRRDGRVHIRSLNVPGEGRFDLAEIRYDKRVPWSNYVRGVAQVLREAGHPLCGFDALVHSTVPFGSGLSSSAALEMAAAVTMQQAGGFALDPLEMALAGQRAENDFVGVRTGILDQYSSALGQEGCALQLDCRDLTSTAVALPPGLQVVICDTRAERNLAGSEYDDRRRQCDEGVRLLQAHYPHITALRDVSLAQFNPHESALPDVVARRCRFIIEENQRVLDLAAALRANDRPALGALFAASYRGARDLFEIGAPPMAQMMAAMRSAPGVIGARQAGAGFGGCMVALVEETAVAPFSAHVSRAYEVASGIQPKVFAVDAAAGAGPLALASTLV